MRDEMIDIGFFVVIVKIWRSQVTNAWEVMNFNALQIFSFTSHVKLICLFLTAKRGDTTKYSLKILKLITFQYYLLNKIVKSVLNCKSLFFDVILYYESVK